MEAHLIVGFFMVNKNTVQLKVNSANTYNYWSSVSITSEINALSRTFQLDITPKVYAQSEIPQFSVLRLLTYLLRSLSAVNLVIQINYNEV